MNPSAAAVEASASTLSGASVKTAEGNDFMNVGRDMVKFENVNLIVNNHCATGDSPSEVREDASSGSIATVFVTLTTLLGGIFGLKASEIDTISSGNIPQQSMPDCDARDHLEPRATVTEIQDIMASAPLSVSDTFNSTVSPLTQSSSSERYIRSMLECNQGYPLYEPEPESQEGVRVGDVGLITEDGGFDLLFNVCPPPNNPDELPDDFEMLRSPETLVRTHFQSETRLFSNGVKRTGEPDVKYTCSGPEGGVLELPLGATRFEAKNKASFKRLATRHAENWYRYTVLTRDRDAPNGSLYIVTSCIKCTDWGIAIFDRPSNPQDYLRFITNEENQNGQSKYRWKGTGAYIPKVALNRGSADSNDADGPNQCVFLRGYKIMLRKDIWDNIANSQTSYVTVLPYGPHSGNESESPCQGDSSNQDDASQSNADNSPGSNCGTTRAAQNTCNRTDTSARVILYEYPKTSPAHPSDLINAILLCQEPKAKVALTHDDDWCDLLQYHSQILDSEALAKVGLSYTSNVDEYGCASLKHSDLNPSPNVTVVESSSNARVTPTSENRLPIDNTTTIPTHKLPSMGDGSVFLQEQNHWHPFKPMSRFSTLIGKKNKDKYHHNQLPSVNETVVLSNSLKRPQTSTDNSMQESGIINGSPRKNDDIKKMNKKEAERLQIEAEKERRKLLAKMHREQARAVMQKRSQKMFGSDIEWLPRPERIGESKIASSGPIRQAHGSLGKNTALTTVDAAAGRYGHQPADDNFVVTDRELNWRERVPKARWRDFDDDDSTSSSDLHSLGQLSTVSQSTEDSDPGPPVRNRPSLFGINRMASMHSLRASFDDFPSSARSSPSYLLDGQLAHDFRMQTSVDPLSPPPMQGLTLSPSISPTLSLHSPWLPLQTPSDGHYPNQDKSSTHPHPKYSDGHLHPPSSYGRSPSSDSNPESSKSAINPIFKAPPLKPQSLDHLPASCDALPPFSELEAVADREYSPVSPMSFSPPSPGRT